MNTNELENNDSENVEEEEFQEEESNDEDVEETDESEDDSQDEEEDNLSEEVKARIAKLEKENKTLKFQKAKLRDKPRETKTQEGLSTEDLIAIARSNVHDDDISLITKYAEFAKVSIREALKDSVLQGIIEKNESKRKSGNATNMGSSKRGQVKVSEETLIANAKKGEMPDEKDLDRLIASRYPKKN